MSVKHAIRSLSTKTLPPLNGTINHNLDFCHLEVYSDLKTGGGQFETNMLFVSTNLVNNNWRSEQSSQGHIGSNSLI